MDKNAKRKLAAGAAAAIVAAGGGAALAASRDTPKDESQAVIADAAKQLGIEPSRLSDALKTALENRVDAAVAAGTLTKAEGDALKAKIEAGDVPLILPGLRAFRPGGFGPGGFGPGFGGGFHHGPDVLDAAASYLGITEEQLRTELESGKTPAQIATAHGKTAAGLVDALVADANKKLDDAVAAGRLTRTEADAIEARLKAWITDFVNGKSPGPPVGPRGFRSFRDAPRPALFGPVDPPRAA